MAINSGVPLTGLPGMKDSLTRIVNQQATIENNASCFYSDVENAIELGASLALFSNAYKEDVVFPLLPTDGSGDLTFTRASTATRVNADGLIETSPVNLALYSEQFDNAAWGKLASVSITANATTSPNGTTTADYVTFSSSGTTTQLYQVITAQAIITQSLYIKYISGTGTGIRLSNGSDINYGLNLEFTNSGATLTGTAGTNVISYEIVNVGNNWFRVSLTYSYTNPEFNLYRYTGTGSDVYAIWGAQLNIGATAKPYFPTTDRLNVPRIDYTGGGCGKLLLEPQRTNLALYSEQFDNAAWAKTRTTSTDNSIVSPDGTQNADTITPNTTADSHLISPATLISLGGVAGTFSVFAKYNGYHLSLSIAGTSGTWTGCVFDLQNGIARTPQSAGAQSPCTAKIEDFGNGWYRCSITYTPYTSGTFYTNIGITSTNNATLSSFGLQYYAGNATSGVYLYGAQIEFGSYVSSYIPTRASSVTRLADAAYKTGISSLIGQTEGTIFFEGVINGVGNTSTNIINSEKNTTSSFYIQRVTSSSQIYAGFIFSGTTTAVVNGGTIAVGQRFKAAWAYKSGSNALYINGTLVDSNTTTFTPPSTFDDLFLNDDTTYFGYQEAVQFNQAAIFPTRLTNAQLATLTTL